MGHWLDGLLDLGSGGGSVIIQWDGVNMPERPIVAFNGQFSAADDAANNRTIISIGPSSMAGDVMGPSNDLRLYRMRGDPDEEAVTVYARSLQWHSTVSAGSAEISLSDADAGAVRVMHQGLRAALFAGSGTVIGNAAGIQQMIGGHRFTLRSIATNITLDTTTKDSIGWIDAATERQVTLPPASVGRTLLLPFVGATTPTLKRAGTELINGAPSNYSMTGDASGGLTIAISDGTNWIARTIRESVSGASFLVGDVNGDTDANYISAITGSGGEVLVTADNFIFPNAELKVTGEDDGAIELHHAGSRVLLASSTTPELGTDFSALRLLGGLRLQTRSVVANVTLDTGTTDAIAWTDTTSSDLEVTLPAASAGRTLLLPFNGTGGILLKRAGLEQINGIGADYWMYGDSDEEGSIVGGIAVAISDGANWIARTITVPPPSGVNPARSINTTAPLTGGGNLMADLTLGINPAAYVAPTRSIATTAPLLGGGDLSANRTLSIDPLAYVAPARSISVTAPLTGGGDLSANRTIGLDPTGYVAPTRTISTTAPLTGGGALSANLTLGINTSAFATSTRSIATTAPLTGGGDLSADRTLAVSSATTLAVGVIQLAGNLAGTAALPLVTGLKADTFSFETAAAAAKGTWTTTGLRVGDATAPTNRFEILGTGSASGDFIANNAANGKARLAGLVGSTATHGALYLGNVTPSASNHAISGNGTNALNLNAGSSGIVSCTINGSTKFQFSESNANTIGTFTQTTQYSGGQICTVKNPAITTDYVMGNGDLFIPVDTTAAGRQVTLPAGPSGGRKAIIKRRAGTNSVTIVGIGTLDGVAVSSIFLMTGSATPGVQPFIYLIADGTGLGWLIVSFYSIQINLP